MNGFRSYISGKPSPSWGRFSCFAAAEKGNALLYVLLAVGLLAALTYVYVQDSRENFSSQNAVHIAEELYAEVNMVKAAIVQCALEYPGGGGDMSGNGVIDSSDNPNNPYPLNPNSALNLAANPGGCTTTSNATGCIPQAGNSNVRNLQCIGAPAGLAAMFAGGANQGRFLPPPPSDFGEWSYTNDSTGVYIQITANGSASSTNALNRLLNKYASGQASISSLTFKAWIQQN